MLFQVVGFQRAAFLSEMGKQACFVGKNGFPSGALLYAALSSYILAYTLFHWPALSGSIDHILGKSNWGTNLTTSWGTGGHGFTNLDVPGCESLLWD